MQSIWITVDWTSWLVCINEREPEMIGNQYYPKENTRSVLVCKDMFEKITGVTIEPGRLYKATIEVKFEEE